MTRVTRPLLWLCLASAGLITGLLGFGATDLVTTAPGSVRPAGEARPLQATREGRIGVWLQPVHAAVHEGEVIARFDTREEHLRLHALGIAIGVLIADEARLAALLGEFGPVEGPNEGRAADDPGRAGSSAVDTVPHRGGACAGPDPRSVRAAAVPSARRPEGSAIGAGLPRPHPAPEGGSALTTIALDGPLACPCTPATARDGHPDDRLRPTCPCPAAASLDDQHGRERELERGERAAAAAALATLQAGGRMLSARRVTLEAQARWTQPACRAHRALARSGRIAAIEHWESERRCLEEEGRVAELGAEEAALAARLTEQSNNEVRRRAAVRQQWGLALAAARSERRALEAEQALLLHQVERATLAAPADGRLHCQRPDYAGVWVPVGEVLCQVVPEAARAEVMAQLPEQDHEGVFPGQAVSLRILALPWTRHGVLPGRVMAIAPDTRPPEVAGAAPVYAVTVVPQAGHPLVAQLAPGMRVEVDFHRGREALWRWLLAPLAEAWLRAGREP